MNLRYTSFFVLLILLTINSSSYAMRITQDSRKREAQSLDSVLTGIQKSATLLSLLDQIEKDEKELEEKRLRLEENRLKLLQLAKETSQLAKKVRFSNQLLRCLQEEEEEEEEEEVQHANPAAAVDSPSIEETASPVKVARIDLANPNSSSYFPAPYSSKKPSNEWLEMERIYALLNSLQDPLKEENLIKHADLLRADLRTDLPESTYFPIVKNLRVPYFQGRKNN